MLGQLIADVEAFGASLRRGQAVNLNDQSSKDRAIELASRYFAEGRPTLVEVLGESEALLAHDELWQQLVRLAHGNNARRTYLRTLASLRRSLTNFNVSTLSSPPVRTPKREAFSLSTDETSILQTLERLIPSAAASYRQGLTDLNGGDRVSYRGTAAELREALRETLDHLAPDDAVTAQAGFKSESGQTKPTMKQKVTFVLTSRGRDKTQRLSAEKSLAVIEELSGEVLRAVYDRASLATHVHESRSEVQQIKRYLDTVLFDLLEIVR
jgi:hypothetical protein